MVNLGGARSDQVVSASDFGTIGPGLIPGWVPIVHYCFPSSFISCIMLNGFLQVI